MRTNTSSRAKSQSHFESELRAIGKKRARQFRSLTSPRGRAKLQTSGSASKQSKGKSFDWGLNLVNEVKESFDTVRLQANEWRNGLVSGVIEAGTSRLTHILLIVGTGLGVLSLAAFITSFLYFSSIYNEEYWKKKIEERVLSPIYGQDDVLVGALNSRARSRSNPTTNAYTLGFIPLASDTDVPPAYREALLEREDKGLRDGGIFYICGVDWLRLPKAWINGRGGSTLSMQIVKNLEGWGAESSFWEKATRKLKEVPAACQLYKHLNKSDSANEEIIRLYAGMHTIWTPGTGIRGIEAGSRVTFDKPPKKLSITEQLLLSAVTAGPLAPPNDNEPNRTKCILIWPIKNNSDYDPNLEPGLKASLTDAEWRQFRIRKNQCKTLWRARHTAQALHDRGLILTKDSQLDEVVEELKQFEDTGVRPINPFLSLTDADSVSLSKRTQEIVRPHLISLLRLEADDLGAIELGSPLNTRIDAYDQGQFVAKMTSILPKIQGQNIDVLCIPLTPQSRQMEWNSKCDGHGSNSPAIVHIGSFNLQTGLLEKSYSDYGKIFEARFSIGSLAKWAILIAAVKNGLQPVEKLCPRSITRNGKALRRVTEPRFGFNTCDSGKNLITLFEATARSDNLAFYELADRLGKERLNDSLQSIGFTPVADPAYELSFGLYEASLSGVMNMAQIVIASANSVSITGSAPRLLVARKSPQTRGGIPLKLTEDARAVLKTLVDAPIRHQNGTLRRLFGRNVAGGKTGTTTSPTRNLRGENFTAGKWTVFYDASNSIVSVMLITSPRPSIPLAKPTLRGTTFGEAETALISKNTGASN